MWIWLIISAAVRMITMGFIIFLGIYLVGIIFGKNVVPKKEDDINISILILSIAGALFYLFQFVLPT